MMKSNNKNNFFRGGGHESVRNILNYYRIYILIITIWLISFSNNIFSQNTAKSGDIRNCDTWATGTNELDNATVLSGHTITTNATSVNVNSITLSSSSSAIDLGGTTMAGACTINQTTNTTILPTVTAYYTRFPPTNSYSQTLGTITINNSKLPSTGVSLILKTSLKVTSTGNNYIFFCNGSTAYLPGTYSSRIYIVKNGVIQQYFEGPDGLGIEQVEDHIINNVKNGDQISIGINFYLDTGHSLSCAADGSIYTYGETMTSQMRGWFQVYSTGTF